MSDIKISATNIDKSVLQGRIAIALYKLEQQESLTANEQEIHQLLTIIRLDLEKKDEPVNWDLWIPLIGKFLINAALVAEHILKK
ncbi:hypothetical protein [Chitinophaga solisilvae]|uniref:hypothetical protein n=1 Tax=Chitinophaga solisilvae TaxID=1233460 RepID=UPI001372272F|nr:hypothetical protein [Chitinophaga solisilvae]